VVQSAYTRGRHRRDCATQPFRILQDPNSSLIVYSGQGDGYAVDTPHTTHEHRTEHDLAPLACLN
jgi:hypothetical protein